MVSFRLETLGMVKGPVCHSEGRGFWRGEAGVRELVSNSHEH